MVATIDVRIRLTPMRALLLLLTKRYVDVPLRTFLLRVASSRMGLHKMLRLNRGYHTERVQAPSHLHARDVLIARRKVSHDKRHARYSGSRSLHRSIFSPSYGKCLVLRVEHTHFYFIFNSNSR